MYQQLDMPMKHNHDHYRVPNCEHSPSNASPPDIFLTNSGSSNKLFINEVGSGHFSDATSSAGLDSGTGASRGAVIADLTGDGNVDIYVGFASGPNKLYVGNGKGNFVDGTASAGVGDTGMAQGVSVGDCDGDGDLGSYPCLTRRGVVSPRYEDDST